MSQSMALRALVLLVVWLVLVAGVRGYLHFRRTGAVEEPCLASVHGDDYLRYAARTGRFLPGIGRLSGR